MKTVERPFPQRHQSADARRERVEDSLENVELWIATILHDHCVSFEEFLSRFAEDLRAAKTKEEAVEAGEKLLALIATMPELITHWERRKSKFH